MDWNPCPQSQESATLEETGISSFFPVIILQHGHFAAAASVFLTKFPLWCKRELSEHKPGTDPLGDGNFKR
jgi:hypothetical protein